MVLQSIRLGFFEQTSSDCFWVTHGYAHLCLQEGFDFSTLRLTGFVDMVYSSDFLDIEHIAKSNRRENVVRSERYAWVVATRTFCDRFSQGFQELDA